MTSARIATCILTLVALEAISAFAFVNHYATQKKPFIPRASKNEADEVKGNPLPKLIIFDLDGCLWRPEMYELLYFSGGAGGPFTKSENYEEDGTLLTTANEPVRLLADVRQVFQDIHSNPEKWQNTKFGISSRTDQPDWARELLEKFTIQSITSEGTFAIGEVINGPIEISSSNKVEHFQKIE